MDIGAIKSRILRRDYSVGIIGLGYVGLPLALRFAEEGFRVLGFDTDQSKVNSIVSCQSYINYIPAARIARAIEAGTLDVTGDMQMLGEMDAIVICVPTPLTKNRQPDLQYVVATADAVAATLRPGQLICLESTTYPGTTEEVFLPRIKSMGLEVGEDVFLAFSPEREDPGNASFDTQTIPKVVGGVTSTCGELAVTLYGQAIDRVVPVASTKVAEATKIMENIYRAVNIAMVNELKVVFDEMGIDVWDVIEAASTKPFGYQPFYPGPGLGGHCIPIDPFYLSWKAREYNIVTRFIELAGEINSSMPSYVVGKLGQALNSQGKPLKNSKVLVLGVAYKRDVSDLRESPGLDIIELLIRAGAHVDYSDPHVPTLPRVRGHQLEMASVELRPGAMRGYDAALIATDHSAFPYEIIAHNAPLVVDTRNALGGRGLRGSHIVKA